MALFNEEKPFEPFDKQKIKDEIVARLQRDCSEYHLIDGEGKIYDMLIIRNALRNVSVSINSMNPYSTTKEEVLQQVFAVTIIESSEGLELFTGNFTIAHFVVKNVDAFFRRLSEIP